MSESVYFTVLSVLTRPCPPNGDKSATRTARADSRLRGEAPFALRRLKPDRRHRSEAGIGIAACTGVQLKDEIIGSWPGGARARPCRDARGGCARVVRRTLTRALEARIHASSSSYAGMHACDMVFARVRPSKPPTGAFAKRARVRGRAPTRGTRAGSSTEHRSARGADPARLLSFRSAVAVRAGSARSPGAYAR